MYRNNIDVVIGCALAAAMFGCSDTTAATPEMPVEDPPGEHMDAPAEQPASAKARVKFKGGKRYGADLGTALGLVPTELCSELSSRDCIAVHNITLGGVEPYRARMDEPLPQQAVATPIAVERIALSACGERAARDFAAPDTAVLFDELVNGEASGDMGPDALRAVAVRLYDRVLHRDATDHEIAALAGLYDQLDNSAAAAQTWAQLSCFAVATSVEALFY